MHMGIRERLSDAVEFFQYLNWPRVMTQFLLLCITALGLLGVVAGHRELYYALRSADWSHVEGIVTRSEVEEYYVDDDSSTPSYRALIEYGYAVRGAYYSSDRRTFQSRALDKNTAVQLVTHYRLDFPVPVYYDPDNPAESVLERGVHCENYAMVITGYILFAGGLLFFILVTVKDYF